MDLANCLQELKSLEKHVHSAKKRRKKIDLKYEKTYDSQHDLSNREKVAQKAKEVEVTDEMIDDDMMTTDDAMK